MDILIDRWHQTTMNQLVTGTSLTYMSGIEWFKKYCSEGQRSLDMDAFIQYPAWLAGKKLAKSTKKSYTTAIKNFFNWLCVEGYLIPSHADALRLQQAILYSNRKRESKLPKTPKRAVLEAIRHEAGTGKESPIRERDIALVEFFFSTGCRRNEARKLCISDLDFTERKCVVMGKGSKERWVFFSKSASQAIQAYLKIRNPGPDEPVFAPLHGTRFLTNKTIWKIIKDIAIRVGSPEFSPHWFRHGFATTMLEKTGNLALVQDMLGHASPVSTRVYAQVATSARQSEHRKVYG